VIGGKYRLIRQLDEGGMGSVWVAHNEDLDIPVAIKLLRADAQTTESAQRLANEARILARLGHPAILKVFDFGRTAAGDPFIVMELLHGECLDSALYERGYFDAIRAVQLLLPIADGLRVAHARGIVHRDLKPANIFLAQTLNGQLQPKILDFGIAHMAGNEATRITRDGSLLGSPAYMSPEQARGKRDIDLRADIWALCVVLYETITGEVPFDGEEYYDVLKAIVHTTPEPTVARCAGDSALWHIIARGIEKAPEDRWPSMDELGRSLALWLLSQGVTEDASHCSLYATWLVPDSKPISSFPGVTIPASLRESTPSSRARADTLPGDLPVPRSHIRSKGRLLSTGGHGAVAFRTADFPAGSRIPMLAVVTATAALIGAGALVWALRGPGSADSTAASAVQVEAALPPGVALPPVGAPPVVQSPTSPAQAAPAAAAPSPSTEAPAAPSAAAAPSSTAAPPTPRPSRIEPQPASRAPSVGHVDRAPSPPRQTPSDRSATQKSRRELKSPY